MDATASIGPQAVIESGAQIAAHAVIGAGVYVGHGSRVGAHSRIFPNAVLYHGVCVGEYCNIQSQAVLGGEGFGFAPTGGGWEKIHQLGGVTLGDR